MDDNNHIPFSGDRLLPITAEEESPFPTLQEVEEMSNQQIQLAHGSRELPKVDNHTWKTDDMTTSEENSAPETPSVSIQVDVSSPSTSHKSQAPSQSYIGHKIPEDFLIKAGLIGNDTENSDSTQVKPFYELNADGSTPSEFSFDLIP